MVFSRMTLQHSSCERGLSLIYISKEKRGRLDRLFKIILTSGLRDSCSSQSNFLLGAQLFTDTLEIVFPYILGSALSIRHRLRIHDTIRKPFFEIKFLVLARMPFKM